MKKETRLLLNQDAEDAWRRLQSEFDTDAILKPSRNSGSRGIAKVSRNMDKGDFIRAYDEALSESRDHSVLIEQFIEGPVFYRDDRLARGNSCSDRDRQENDGCSAFCRVGA